MHKDDCAPVNSSLLLLFGVKIKVERRYLNVTVTTALLWGPLLINTTQHQMTNSWPINVTTISGPWGNYYLE